MAFVTAQQQANATAMNAVLQASASFAATVAMACQQAITNGQVNPLLGVLPYIGPTVNQAAWAAVFPNRAYPTSDPNGNPFDAYGVTLSSGNPATRGGCPPISIVPNPSLATMLATIFAPVLNILAPGSGSIVQTAANAANGPDTTYVPPSALSGLTGGGGLTSMLLFAGAAVLLGVLLERR